MNYLSQEPEIQQELETLLALFAEHEAVVAFTAIRQQVQQNQRLIALEESIKAAQKEAVHYAHYHKPEAEKEMVKKIVTLTEEYDQHPLVLLYRECLQEVDELLQYITQEIQQKVNDAIEEESTHASKN